MSETNKINEAVKKCATVYFDNFEAGLAIKVAEVGQKPPEPVFATCMAQFLTMPIVTNAGSTAILKTAG